jgi:hypothetical protein
MTDNEDIKAKMREALDRKKAHDPGVEHEDHHKGGGPKNQGPGDGGGSGGPGFRRKTG